MKKLEYQNPKSLPAKLSLAKQAGEINSNDKNSKFKTISNFVLRISNFKFQRGLPATPSQASGLRGGRGQSLVEIIIAMGLSVILLPALLTGLVSSRQGKVQQAQRTQAVYLLNETIDAVRSVREKGWESFAINGTFHPAVSGTSWALAPGSVVINGLTQQIVIEDMNRGVCPGVDCGKIVTSGGILDTSSKRVNISISWNQPSVSTVNAILFITRYLESKYFTQTTVADFNTGIKSGTVVTNTLGGEVTLGAGGHGEWCDPNLNITALDLPKNGVANAISAIPGKVVAGTGENAAGVAFANIAVADTYPPTSVILGEFSSYKTNGVFNDANYAYIATDDHAKEMIILDLNQRNPLNNEYVEIGYFNAPGQNTGKSVAVSGNIGFLTVNNVLYSIDLSSKSGSRAQLASRTLAGNGTKAVVNGSYVFVSIAGATQELQIIQFNAAGTTLTITGSADVNGQAAYDVSVNPSGTRAYLATGADASKPEFFIINTSSKTGARPLVGSYNANGMDPNAVAVVTNNKAVLVGTGGEEYQVIDIANESSPVRCGGLNINTGVNGIASVLETDGDAYSYIITGDSASELKIIEGGPGGYYVPSGDFTSSVFDAGYSTAFNRFDVSVNRPTSTDVEFQVAVSQAVGGSCSGASYNFVGPDSTSSTFFTTSETSGIQGFSLPIPPSINPGRCFKYKAFFSTTAPTSNPIFNDITVNYSP